MTSRFAKQFPCLNGPKEGYLIDSPPNAAMGSACALPWINARGGTSYAVYVLTEAKQQMNEGEEAVVGLMFVQSHPTPERAQNHVRTLAKVLTMAQEHSRS